MSADIFVRVSMTARVLEILLIEAINVPRDEGELLRGLGGQQA